MFGFFYLYIVLMRHITKFNEFNKYHQLDPALKGARHDIGETIKIKSSIDNILKTKRIYKRNHNVGMEKFLGKAAKIDEVIYSDVNNEYLYQIDIDNGDFWWIDDCFEK